MQKIPEAIASGIGRGARDRTLDLRFWSLVISLPPISNFLVFATVSAPIPLSGQTIRNFLEPFFLKISFQK
jgi:hypothetical protein